LSITGELGDTRPAVNAELVVTIGEGDDVAVSGLKALSVTLNSKA